MKDYLLKIAKDMGRIPHSCDHYKENKCNNAIIQSLQQISHDIQCTLGENVSDYFESIGVDDYMLTPKIDVRAIIVRDNEILLVKDDDDLWSVPGGWAEFGQSPKENVEREVLEETGYRAEVVKLLGICYRNKYPPQLRDHVYKIFFQCKILDENLINQDREFESKYYAVEKLPDLSEKRITEKQIRHFINCNRYDYSCYYD